VGFLKGIKLANFLDTTAEWHALIQGWCEVLCPWRPRHKEMTEKLLLEIHKEHHYYMAGRVLGVGSWLGIVLCLINNFTRL